MVSGYSSNIQILDYHLLLHTYAPLHTHTTPLLASRYSIYFKIYKIIGGTIPITKTTHKRTRYATLTLVGLQERQPAAVSLRDLRS